MSHVCMLGNSGVGKTCILKRYFHGDFDFDLMSTVGIEH